MESPHELRRLHRYSAVQHCMIPGYHWEWEGPSWEGGNPRGHVAGVARLFGPWSSWHYIWECLKWIFYRTTEIKSEIRIKRVYTIHNVQIQYILPLLPTGSSSIILPSPVPMFPSSLPSTVSLFHFLAVENITVSAIGTTMYSTGGFAPLHLVLLSSYQC